jgi:phenylalanyl-tRNA synthetase beta chain
MKYSYIWLKELSKTKKTPKQLAELLTMRAFELEDMKTEGRETQLEFSILPNRGHDALSHIGLAREICACEGRRFINGGPASIMEVEPPNGRLKIEVKERKLCPRYVGAIIENIKVAASPKWMQERLLVSGVKPINNVVDITNYVMLETGQPLHAFDIAKLVTRNAKPEIIIRKAKKGEKIKLLDEKIYELTENDLVIADEKKALALAGVMGGFDSSITDNTTSIILESANFNSTSIRKTRTLHNIITESSHRFEREIDLNLAEIAIAKAVELIKKTAGPKVVVSAIVDVYPKKKKPWQIKLDADYVSSLLGEVIPTAKIKNILVNLGMKVKPLGNLVSKLNVEVPTFRIDLKTQEDLIEEIGRIYGYENIKEQAPVIEVKTPPENPKWNFENELRDIMTGFGFSEVMNYSFYGAEDITKCDLRVDDHIEVANPLSMEQQYLRRDLISSLLKNVELNLKNFSRVQIFEIGKKFCNDKGTFSEIPLLVGALSGDNASGGLPFFELKGSLQSLFKRSGVRDVDYQILNEEYKFWHPTRSAKIIVNGKKIGRIGEIKPQALKNYGIKQRVAVFGLKIDELMKIGVEDRQYKPIDRFPVVERDLSMFVGKDTKYADIALNIRKKGGNLVKNIDLFDIFEKAGEKSLALRIKIGSDTKTLTSEEIDAVMKKIISALEKELKVKVRK